MGTIAGELSSTWTARWYQAASGTPRADAWAERLRYFTALSELLTELVKGGHQQHQQQQLQQITPRALVSEVARRAHFAAHETLYKRFRPEWEGPIARWAGDDDAVKPRNALVAEAKIVSFWPYREEVLRLAGQPEVALTEVGEAYLRALATWASDDVPLAACRPAGPPACVTEDMKVLAELWMTSTVTSHAIPGPHASVHVPDRRCEHGRDRDQVPEKAGQLERLAQSVVRQVLDDPAISPGQAVEAVRDDLGRLLADPADPVLDQLAHAAAQLSDRLARHRPGAPGEPGELPVTPDQARQLLATLSPLTTQLEALATA